MIEVTKLDAQDDELPSENAELHGACAEQHEERGAAGELKPRGVEPRLAGHVRIAVLVAAPPR